jgi:tetratricopeptide (TPR) repeat protein
MSPVVGADNNKHGEVADIRTLVAEGQKHLAQKDYVQARKACLTALKLNPTHRVALYFLALCDLYQDRLQEAVTVLSTLVQRHSDHVNGLVLLSKVYLRLGKHRESTRHARQALEADIRDDRVLTLVARILGESEDHRSAKAAYARALRIKPASAEHLCNYASILRIEGRIEEAIDTLERCIALDETHCKAHWMLASLQQQTLVSNHIPRLTRLRGRNDLGDTDRMLIAFALAKEFEDIGKYEQAFDRLAEGCRLKRASIQYNVNADIRQLRQLAAMFEPAYISRRCGTGYGDYAPIFVLGLPRTGSTLIEQILGAHQQIFPAGELPMLGNEIDRLFPRNADGYPDFTSGVDAEIDFEGLGRRYVDASMDFICSAQHKSAYDTSMRFVDKMPQNFMYVGFILLALPEAKVIVTERHAMDTCLSNFKQLYNDPFYQFSYQLDELGKYFLAYRQLMQHWCNQFGQRILSVSYENLVQHPKKQVARIFEHCGLEWNDEYLDRSKRDGLVATASATQVRDAINTRSVDRWKRYEGRLAPLHAQLANVGTHILCADANS